MTNNIFGKVVATVALATAVLMGPSAAQAQFFSGTGTGSEDKAPLAATVNFTSSGSNLFVTLCNTSTAAALSPSDVLTGVFFTISGNPTLTPVSALVSADSVVLYAPAGTGTGPGTNVGGEFAYANNLSGAPGGANQGISSSGLNFFGDANFNGPNLQGPVAVDGIQYGQVGPGGTTGGNKAVTRDNALIQSCVDFTLTGYNGGAISNVFFQYGTSLSEGGFPGRPGTPVPEPTQAATMGVGLLGLAGLAFAARKRRFSMAA